jgi:hypothetical protein
MKKFFALIFCLLMVASVVLTGCNKKTEENTKGTVNFGAALYVSNLAATDANDDKDGTGKIDVTVAAVTVDANGKIVSCELDVSSNTVKFSLDGKAIANTEFKTKYEYGKDYNMVAYGGAAKEWYEQADSFEALVAGKTLAEVKALVAEGNKGTDEVVNAGCTIAINEFVGAIENAYNNATVEVSSSASLKVNVAVDQTLTDADGDKNGSNKIAINVFAAASDKDGKIVAASSDCLEVSFTFNENGASTLDTTKAIASKKEQGDNYGMVAYGGATKEWYEQAAAFDAACVGKTTSEIAGLMGEDGKGVADLQSA